MTKIVGIIPARKGSQRLKNKNIYPVNNLPMLAYTINACKQSKYDIEVFVSTDSEEIADIAKEYGAKIHKRTSENAKSNVYKQVAIREAAEYIDKNFGKKDIYLSLQANSPTMTSDEIDKCIDALIKYKRDEIISVDKNLMQDASIRVFRGKYVFQQDLSTNCGVVVTNLHDVHTIEDVKIVEKILSKRKKDTSYE